MINHHKQTRTKYTGGPERGKTMEEYKEIYLVTADGETKAYASLQRATTHAEAVITDGEHKRVTIDCVQLIDD